MDLAVPEPRRAPRTSRSGVGHFVDDVGYDGFEHFLAAYRAAMAEMPTPSSMLDVPTGFGTVRAYRFDGPESGTPVVLLPGRGASTPMWADNLPGLLEHRTVYCLDTLGEAGLSVQSAPIASVADEARWLDETLAGLGLARAHLLGVSIGGWAAVNLAVHGAARIGSLTLLDPVMTFASIPLKVVLVSGAMTSPGVPEALRRRILRWISGGTDVDDSVPVARLISAATIDFVIRLPAPKLISEDQLRALDVPVLALLAGRSVMLNATRAAARAKELLPNGRVEVWPDASHAINGEFPERIAETAGRFWDVIDHREH